MKVISRCRYSESNQRLPAAELRWVLLTDANYTSKRSMPHETLFQLHTETNLVLIIEQTPQVNRIQIPLWLIFLISQVAREARYCVQRQLTCASCIHVAQVEFALHLPTSSSCHYHNSVVVLSYGPKISQLTLAEIIAPHIKAIIHVRSVIWYMFP